jgi:hypothetical protein
MKRTTCREAFKAVFITKRNTMGIREAAIAAFKEAVGPLQVSPRLGGYVLSCDPFETVADDNENDFLKAASDLAGCFSKPIKVG